MLNYTPSKRLKHIYTPPCLLAMLGFIMVFHTVSCGCINSTIGDKTPNTAQENLIMEVPHINLAGNQTTIEVVFKLTDTKKVVQLTTYKLKATYLSGKGEFFYFTNNRATVHSVNNIDETLSVVGENTTLSRANNPLQVDIHFTPNLSTNQAKLQLQLYDGSNNCIQTIMINWTQ